MIFFFSQPRRKLFSKITLVLVLFSFLGTSLGVNYAHAALTLPEPTQLLGLSATYSFPILKGLKLNPANPLQIEFIIDSGNWDAQYVGTGLSPVRYQEALKKESEKLIRYFLAGLTIPEDDLWVNLSVYEKDRIINDSAASTDVGRDMLAQDYVLKQLVSSLTHPENSIGNRYWQSVYSQIGKLPGTGNLPIDTFNKIWIAPDKAEVYEYKNTAVVNQATLKAMLEQDFLALQKGTKDEVRGTKDEKAGQINKVASDVMREVVVPKITDDINSGKNFATLRQIYYSLILAKWFKEKFKESFYKHYINQKKIKGIDTNDPQAKEKIYNLYTQAFKKGIYDYIKKESDPATHKQVRRRYFSGGVMPLVSSGVVQTQVLSRAEQIHDSSKGLNVITTDILSGDAANDNAFAVTGSPAPFGTIGTVTEEDQKNGKWVRFNISQRLNERLIRKESVLKIYRRGTSRSLATMQSHLGKRNLIAGPGFIRGAALPPPINKPAVNLLAAGYTEDGWGGAIDIGYDFFERTISVRVRPFHRKEGSDKPFYITVEAPITSSPVESGLSAQDRQYKEHVVASLRANMLKVLSLTLPPNDNEVIDWAIAELSRPLEAKRSAHEARVRKAIEDRDKPGKGKTILVTGGAGYIGGHTIYEALLQGYDIVAVDNFVKGREEMVDFLREFAVKVGRKFTFVPLDLADRPAIDTMFREHPEIDDIIHFAAYIEIGPDALAPWQYFENNLINPLNLVEAAEKYKKINGKRMRIIPSLTAAVYDGDQPMPLTEASIKNPLSVYGFTKHWMGEVMKDSNLDAFCVHYFNAAAGMPFESMGEWHSPETHAIPRFIRLLLEGKPVQLYGKGYPTDSGTPSRDYISVLDLATAHIAGLEIEDNLPGETSTMNQHYNLATGEGLEVAPLAKKIAGVLKEVVPGIEYREEDVGPRAGDAAKLYASPGKIKDYTLRSKTAHAWELDNSDIDTIVRSAIIGHLNMLKRETVMSPKPMPESDMVKTSQKVIARLGTSRKYDGAGPRFSPEARRQITGRLFRDIKASRLQIIQGQLLERLKKQSIKITGVATDGSKLFDMLNGLAGMSQASYTYSEQDRGDAAITRTLIVARDHDIIVVREGEAEKARIAIPPYDVIPIAAQELDNVIRDLPSGQNVLSLAEAWERLSAEGAALLDKPVEQMTGQEAAALVDAYNGLETRAARLTYDAGNQRIQVNKSSSSSPNVVAGSTPATTDGSKREVDSGQRAKGLGVSASPVRIPGLPDIQEQSQGQSGGVVTFVPSRELLSGEKALLIYDKETGAVVAEARFPAKGESFYLGDRMEVAVGRNFFGQIERPGRHSWDVRFRLNGDSHRVNIFLDTDTYMNRKTGLAKYMLSITAELLGSEGPGRSKRFYLAEGEPDVTHRRSVVASPAVVKAPAEVSVGMMEEALQSFLSKERVGQRGRPETYGLLRSFSSKTSLAYTLELFRRKINDLQGRDFSLDQIQAARDSFVAAVNARTSLDYQIELIDEGSSIRVFYRDKERQPLMAVDEWVVDGVERGLSEIFGVPSGALTNPLKLLNSFRRPKKDKERIKIALRLRTGVGEAKSIIVDVFLSRPKDGKDLKVEWNSSADPKASPQELSFRNVFSTLAVTAAEPESAGSPVGLAPSASPVNGYDSEGLATAVEIAVAKIIDDVPPDVFMDRAEISGIIKRILGRKKLTTAELTVNSGHRGEITILSAEIVGKLPNDGSNGHVLRVRYQDGKSIILVDSTIPNKTLPASRPKEAATTAVFAIASDKQKDGLGLAAAAGPEVVTVRGGGKEEVTASPVIRPGRPLTVRRVRYGEARVGPDIKGAIGTVIDIEAEEEAITSAATVLGTMGVVGNDTLKRALRALDICERRLSRRLEATAADSLHGIKIPLPLATVRLAIETLKIRLEGVVGILISEYIQALKGADRRSKAAAVKALGALKLRMIRPTLLRSIVKALRGYEQVLLRELGGGKVGSLGGELSTEELAGVRAVLAKFEGRMRKNLQGTDGRPAVMKTVGRGASAASPLGRGDVAGRRTRGASASPAPTPGDGEETASISPLGQPGSALPDISVERVETALEELTGKRIASEGFSGGEPPHNIIRFPLAGLMNKINQKAGAVYNQDQIRIALRHLGRTINVKPLFYPFTIIIRYSGGDVTISKKARPAKLSGSEAAVAEKIAKRVEPALGRDMGFILNPDVLRDVLILLNSPTYGRSDTLTYSKTAGGVIMFLLKGTRRMEVLFSRKKDLNSKEGPDLLLFDITDGLEGRKQAPIVIERSIFPLVPAASSAAVFRSVPAAAASSTPTGRDLPRLMVETFDAALVLAQRGKKKYDLKTLLKAVRVKDVFDGMAALEFPGKIPDDVKGRVTQTVEHTQNLFKAWQDITDRRFRDNPRIWILALLFHDIGKITGYRDHERTGVELIEKHNLLQPLVDSGRISREEKLAIEMIIRYHIHPHLPYSGERNFGMWREFFRDPRLQQWIAMHPDRLAADTVDDLLRDIVWVTYFDGVAAVGSYARAKIRFMMKERELLRSILFADAPTVEKALAEISARDVFDRLVRLSNYRDNNLDDRRVDYSLRMRAAIAKLEALGIPLFSGFNDKLKGLAGENLTNFDVLFSTLAWSRDTANYQDFRRSMGNHRAIAARDRINVNALKLMVILLEAAKRFPQPHGYITVKGRDVDNLEKVKGKVLSRHLFALNRVLSRTRGYRLSGNHIDLLDVKNEVIPGAGIEFKNDTRDIVFIIDPPAVAPELSVAASPVPDAEAAGRAVLSLFQKPYEAILAAADPQELTLVKPSDPGEEPGAVVIIKAEIFNKLLDPNGAGLTNEQREQVVSMVVTELEKKGAVVRGAKFLNATALKEMDFVDRYMFAHAYRAAKTDNVPEDARRRMLEKFPDVGSLDRVLSYDDAVRKFGATIGATDEAQYEVLWKKQLGTPDMAKDKPSDTWYQRVGIVGVPYIVMHGLTASTKMRTYKPGSGALIMDIRFTDESKFGIAQGRDWAGPTNPRDKTARLDQARSKILAIFPAADGVMNGLHFSAGYVEWALERSITLGQVPRIFSERYHGEFIKAIFNNPKVSELVKAVPADIPPGIEIFDLTKEKPWPVTAGLLDSLYQQWREEHGISSSGVNTKANVQSVASPAAASTAVSSDIVSGSNSFLSSDKNELGGIKMSNIPVISSAASQKMEFAAIGPDFFDRLTFRIVSMKHIASLAQFASLP